MTTYISTLKNLKFFANTAAVGYGLHFASCQLSRLFWLLAAQAANLLCSAFVSTWHPSQPNIFAFYHLFGCGFEVLALFRSIFHAVSAAL